MREIKFRIWDAYHGFMSVNNETPLVGNILNAICGQDEPLNDEEKKRFKLMQYTGLKDRNGKEIYEGDLIDLGTYLGKVVFNESDFGVPCFCIENDESCYEPFFAKGDEPRIWFEVIGNIYENPELLHAKE